MRRHMDDMQDALTEFAEIVEDGVITPEELEMVPEIKDGLQRPGKRLTKCWPP